jgi:hypothetical protein
MIEQAIERKFCRLVPQPRKTGRKTLTYDLFLRANNRWMGIVEYRYALYGFCLCSATNSCWNVPLLEDVCVAIRLLRKDILAERKAARGE